MRTQWTAKGNRDTVSSCSCDRGLHRYLRNFGGGGWTPPQTSPLGTPLSKIKNNETGRCFHRVGNTRYYVGNLPEKFNAITA